MDADSFNSGVIGYVSIKPGTFWLVVVVVDDGLGTVPRAAALVPDVSVPCLVLTVRPDYGNVSNTKCVVTTFRYGDVMRLSGPQLFAGRDLDVFYASISDSCETACFKPDVSAHEVEYPNSCLISGVDAGADSDPDSSYLDFMHHTVHPVFTPSPSTISPLKV